MEVNTDRAPGDNKHYLYFTGRTRILITEWIPFGENTIMELSRKLEADRSTSTPSILTEVIDPEPEEMIFRTRSIPTVIQVIKSKEGEVVEFKCTVSYAETNADIQEEHFGVHVDNMGRIIYGLELLEADGLRGKYSVDSVSAVLADLTHDSSRMLNTVVSKYQQRLLELIYFNEPLHRDKFFLVFAEGIEPNLDVSDFAPGTPYLLELQQILGHVYDATVLDEGILLFRGANGIVIVGEDSFKYERQLLNYAFLKSIENSLDNALARMWRSWDITEELKNAIFSKEGGGSLRDVNRKINELQSDVSIVNSVFSYLKNTLSSLEGIIDSLSESPLYIYLEMGERFNVLKRRVDDAIPVAATLSREIEGLVSVANSLLDSSMARLMDAVEENTKKYVAIGEALELLEIGIFGVYIVELLHIILQYGRFEEDLINTELLGVSLALWIITSIGIGGIVLAWYLLRLTKRRVLSEEKLMKEKQKRTPF
jgi:hypothetical protein